MGEDGSRRAIEAGVLVTAAESAHPKRHYGRRKGWKLSPHQAGLIEALLPRLMLAPQPGLDPREYFSSEAGVSPPSLTLPRKGGGDLPRTPPPLAGEGRGEGWPRDVWLEVGFGGGEHLAWQAEHNPDIGIIGAEPFVAGMAKLLAKIAAPSASLRSAPPPEGEDKKAPFPSSPLGGGPAEGRGGGRSNIRIYPDDALDVIEALPDACLGRVFILFPDPWPKTRHHKRRFLSMEMLDRLARVLREGAELRFATDDNGYLVWALERLQAHTAFQWTAQSPADWRTRAPDWPETRYEAKALHGKPVYLRFLRRSP